MAQFSQRKKRIRLDKKENKIGDYGSIEEAKETLAVNARLMNEGKRMLDSPQSPFTGKGNAPE